MGLLVCVVLEGVCSMFVDSTSITNEARLGNAATPPGETETGKTTNWKHKPERKQPQNGKRTQKIHGNRYSQTDASCLDPTLQPLPPYPIRDPRAMLLPLCGTRATTRGNATREQHCCCTVASIRANKRNRHGDALMAARFTALPCDRKRDMLCTGKLPRYATTTGNKAFVVCV